MIFRLLELYKNKRLVLRQVLNNDPPEARAAHDEMISLHWPKWRIWMVLASAYQTNQEWLLLILDRLISAIIKYCFETLANIQTDIQRKMQETYLMNR